jgi:hypothetical protein
MVLPKRERCGLYQRRIRLTKSLPGGAPGKGQCGLTAYNKAAQSQTHQSLTHCQVTAYKELLPLQAEPKALNAI